MTELEERGTPALDGARLTVGRIVELERLAPGRWAGHPHAGAVTTRGYGGSVLAHALAAVAETVAVSRGLHSLHASFLAGVDPTTPMVFDAVSLRQGRSYSVSRVDGRQDGRLGFTMNASFKRPQPGTHLRHAAMPAGIQPPEHLPDGFADRGPDSPSAGVLEYRDAGPLASVDAGEIARAGWFRHRDDVGASALAQACALVYLTDVTLAPTAFGRLGGGPRPPGAVIGSLDHSLWLHGDPRDLRTADWLLFVQRSRVERDGRTFARGEVWTRAGDLLASAAQEALIRIPETASSVQP